MRKYTSILRHAYNLDKTTLSRQINRPERAARHGTHGTHACPSVVQKENWPREPDGLLLVLTVITRSWLSPCCRLSTITHSHPMSPCPHSSLVTPRHVWTIATMVRSNTPVFWLELNALIAGVCDCRRSPAPHYHAHLGGVAEE